MLTTHAWETDTLAGAARLLREMLASRAKRQVFWANTRERPDLRADAPLVHSRLSDPRAEIAAGDIVEGYVTPADLGHLVRDYLLTPVVGHSNR